MNQVIERGPVERRRIRILIAAVVGTLALSWAYAMAADAATQGVGTVLIAATR